MNTNHLAALHVRLSHERDRLARAKNDHERQLRAVWIAQVEAEIARERAFLGISEPEAVDNLSDDELLAELKP